MILLTKLNGVTFHLNSDLIKKIEGEHDTVITLVGGETLRIKESDKVIVQRIIDYKRSIHNIELGVIE